MRVLTLVLLFSLTGCVAWKPVPRASVGTQEAGPQQVRLLLLDGRQYYVQRAQTVGDSLVGQIGDTRVAFALTDVRRVDTRQASKEDTQAAAVVGGGVATGVAVGVALTVVVAVAVLEFFLGFLGG